MTGIEYDCEHGSVTAIVDGERIGSWATTDEARRGVQRFLQGISALAAKNIETGIVHPD